MLRLSLAFATAGLTAATNATTTTTAAATIPACFATCNYYPTDLVYPTTCVLWHQMASAGGCAETCSDELKNLGAEDMMCEFRFGDQTASAPAVSGLAAVMMSLLLTFA